MWLRIRHSGDVKSKGEKVCTHVWSLTLTVQFPVNMSVPLNHTLMNFRQFHILEMVVKSNGCLYSCALPDDGLVRKRVEVRVY